MIELVLHKHDRRKWSTNNQINFSTNVLDIFNTNISKYNLQIQLQGIKYNSKSKNTLNMHNEQFQTHTIPKSHSITNSTMTLFGLNKDAKVVKNLNQPTWHKNKKDRENYYRRVLSNQSTKMTQKTRKIERIITDGC